MALIHWLKAVSGAFSVGADWSGGAVPGPADTAILDAPGSAAYTVSVTSNATVAGVQTTADALLDIEADFSATGGTGAGANAGAVRIENAATLTLQGTVENVGTIEIFGTNAPTSIEIGSAGLTLTGGGGVFLNFQGGSQQQIVPAPGGAVLDDVDNRISGQGLLGGSAMTIITGNQGFIEAKAGTLTIDTGAHTIVNFGTIDAEGLPYSNPDPPASGLVDSPVENDGLLLIDGDGATLVFNQPVTGTGVAEIEGGVLQFKSGFNQVVGFVSSDGTLVLDQSKSYTNYIAKFSATGGEFLDLGDIGFVSASEATYSGTTSGGVLTVSDGTHTAHIHFSGDYTASVFTASPDGDGGTLVTTAAKAIDWLNPTSGTFQTAANWAGGIAPGAYNDAVLDAAGGAPYTVTASTPQTIAGLQGAANARLLLSAAMTTSDGTDDGIVAGVISLANGGRLTIGATFDDTSAIELAAPAGLSELVVTGATTLTGGGAVYMDDAPASAIVGASSSAVLTNLQNAIAGAGSLGLGGLTLINGAAGRILSDVTAKTLVINTGANTVLNAGLLEGAGGGMLVGSAVENDGVVKAVTALTFNRAVTGSGRAVIAGGTLRFLGAFDQAATFIGAGGMLGLAQSRSYTGVVSGFAATGADALDLADVTFTGAGEATFSGTAAGGVLTVRGGTHTAHIHLHGNYTGVSFIAAADGQGGTMVTGAEGKTSIRNFVSAISGLGAEAGAAAVHGVVSSPPAPLLLAAGTG